jgi:hypothetical protein
MLDNTELTLPMDIPATRVDSEPVRGLQTIATSLHQHAAQAAKAVRTKETADIASDMIGDIKNFEDRVDASDLGRHLWSLNRLRNFFLAIKKNLTEHCEDDKDLLQASIDKWRDAEFLKAETARKAEENKLKKEAEDRRIKEAAKLEKLKKPPQMVNQALSRPIAYTPPPVQIPKVKNQVVTQYYSIDVWDKRAFLKAITDGPPDQLINEDYVTIDIKKLEQLAKQRDGKITHNGLAVYEGNSGQQRRTA